MKCNCVWPQLLSIEGMDLCVLSTNSAPVCVHVHAHVHVHVHVIVLTDVNDFIIFDIISFQMIHNQYSYHLNLLHFIESLMIK